MASSFKIKLKLPPNPNHPGTSTSSAANSPQRSSVPAEGDSSVADGGSSAVSGDEGEEFDELEDSPPPNDGTPDPSNADSQSSRGNQKSAARKSGGSASSASMTKKSRSIPMGLPKPVDMMTIEEIEALPAAKRRKSLKARGAAGPGRGWRKGLKMDQKPVYVQPGESPPRKVAPTTPSSFASRPKSALARDALSKTGTPLRSESPYSRASPMGIDDLILEAGETKPRKVEEEKKSAASVNAQPTSSSMGFTRVYHRSTQPVLPLAKIPIGFVTVSALDKSGSKRPVRAWQRQTREVVSVTGKAWSALSWITKQQSQVQLEKEQAEKEAAQRIGSAAPIDIDTPPSTPGGESNNQLPVQPSQRTAEVRPSPLSTSTMAPSVPKHDRSSPEVDWRGSSAAFSAANKRKA